MEAALAAVNREEFDVLAWNPRRSREATPWDGSAAVLLLGTYGVERAALEAIGRAHAAGTGLVVAAGPGLEVSRLDGVLPWLVGKESSTAAQALTLAPTDIRHPAFRALDGNAGWLSTVRFDRALDLGAARDGHVLARFSDGAAAIVERDGKARLLVLASDLSNTWNDFALHPAFVPFVHGLVQYAAASGAPPRELRVGERPDLTRPGVIEDRRARVAVNVDPAEADRARLTPAAFTAAVPRAGGDGRAAEAVGLGRPRARAVAVAVRPDVDAGGSRRRERRRTTSVSPMNTDAVIVRDSLDSVRARWQRRARLSFAARAGAGVAAIGITAWAAIRIGGVSGGALAALAGATLALAAAWLFVAQRRRPPLPADRALARHIEEGHPALEDRLVTAVDVFGRDTPGPLDGAFMADAARALGRESLDDVVPGDSVRMAGLRAAAVAALLLVVFVAWIDPARRAWGITAAFLMPGRIVLEVTPGHARVAPGQPLEISARTGVADLVPEITIAAAQRSRRMAMTPGGDRFRTRFDTIPGSFTYRVSAGGRTSPEYRVTLLEAPRLEGIDLHYEFPPYTKLAPRDEHDGGDIYAPAGTSVRLAVRASKATASGALVLGGTRVPLVPGERGALTATLPITADGSYRVALTSHDGLAAPGDTEYFIRVLDDRPPEVRILRPASDRQVSPLEEVTVEARADDDYGLQSFDLGLQRARRRVEDGTVRRRQDAAHGHRPSHAVPRGSRRRARGLRDLLRARPGHRPRQAVDRGAQRHLLPRGDAVQPGVLGRADARRWGHRAGGRSTTWSPRRRTSSWPRGSSIAGAAPASRPTT